MLVVADASPLIYLSRLEVLQILASAFGGVVVPKVVWQEVTEGRPAAPGVEALLAAAWIQVVDNGLPEVDLGLDPGETAAILLAEQLSADLLLIDEQLGRRVAEARGLSVRGTLGLLVLGKQLGIVPELRPLLEQLVEDGFRVHPALIDETLVAVGEPRD